MPYTLPTPDDLKTYLPAFASVPNETIQMYLDGAQVDESWIETDYQPAVMLWAAWAMTDGGIGSGGELGAAVASGVSSLKSGTLSVTFSDGATSASGYETNGYGKRFLALYRKNKAGPRVIVGAGGCASGYAKDWVWPMGGGYL
jgi:hypothetical protein